MNHKIADLGICRDSPGSETALMERPGAILSRSQLEERLYGWGEEVESNAVDVLIHSIRKKFDKDIILNVRGAGWMVAKAAS